MMLSCPQLYFYDPGDLVQLFFDAHEFLEIVVPAGLVLCLGRMFLIKRSPQITKLDLNSHEHLLSPAITPDSFQSTDFSVPRKRRIARDREEY